MLRVSSVLISDALTIEPSTCLGLLRGDACLPDPPRNCSIANQTSEALVVECTPGFDGGLPQHFVMEAWDDGALLSNTSSLAPEFVVRGLEAGMDVTLKVCATNLRGQSVSISLAADIMKVAEKRMGGGYHGPPEKGVLLPPVVGAIVGGVGAVLVLLVVGIVLTHYTHRSRPQTHSKDAQPTLTNVYVGSLCDVCSEDAHETHAHSKAANPDVVRGTGTRKPSPPSSITSSELHPCPNTAASLRKFLLFNPFEETLASKFHEHWMYNHQPE
ncbi:hypothetical protein GWK47_005520 [Chionoecetes opilio]|uniref:Fibronectin type-III domain-containing protein n=1 Tax=Chionoecetes opilio TaxID=41210 RepID=A0A8J4YA48_CHIOP|nr:hypothetical protein GWK47_005520 [Chionoecetes opilio]